MIRIILKLVMARIRKIFPIGSQEYLKRRWNNPGQRKKVFLDLKKLSEPDPRWTILVGTTGQTGMVQQGSYVYEKLCLKLRTNSLLADFRFWN